MIDTGGFGKILVFFGIILTVAGILYIRGQRSPEQSEGKTAAFRPQIGNGRSVFRPRNPGLKPRWAPFIFADKIPWFGKLPGDIYIKKENFTLYFPLATSILLSIAFSLDIIFDR